MVVSVRAALDGLGLETRESGSSLEGPCPYHGLGDEVWTARWRAGREDSTWSIRHRGERRGLHHCFACHRGGTLVDLVMHVIDIGYPTAKQWLSELPEEPPPVIPSGVRLELHDGSFRIPREVVWSDPLEEWPTPMRRYIAQRGVTVAQVQRWGIGYAVDGRLAGRVVIPIFDASTDEIVSYMARTISKDPEVERYLYPLGDDRADNDAMFGERGWPDVEDRRDATVVITEGALNALAVDRAMRSSLYVASLGGSDVRPLHVAKLATFGRVVVCTDMDAAGDDAASELAAKLARHVSVARAILPPGTDAADCAADELKRCLTLAEYDGSGSQH